MRRIFTVLLASLLLSTLPLHAQQLKKRKNSDTENIGRRNIIKGSWNMWSPEKEIELGEEIAREVTPSLSILNDLETTLYIQSIADRIVRHSDLQVPLRVKVIDSNEPNAFALPGGQFFINTGMILETRTEAELAAVISHEAAHVAARHATRQMTKGRIFNMVSIPLVFVGGPIAFGVQQGLAFVGPLSLLKFSRDSEREADFLGLQYHTMSGYDPVAFLDFFERMKSKQKEKESGIVKMFSTHPMTKDRIAAAQKSIANDLPTRENYVVSTSEYDRAYLHLSNLLGERTKLSEDAQMLRRRQQAPPPVRP